MGRRVKESNVVIDRDETPSEWCMRMYNESLERSDNDAAKNYMKMYDAWKSKGM